MREDWVEVKIGEVFDIITGTTPSKRIKDNYGDFIPFVKPPDINNSPINNTSDFLSESGKLKGRILPVNSVLITCIGNLGRVGINEKYEIAFNQQINALKPLSYIYPKFTFYQAQSLRFRTQLEKLSTSTTVALVNKSRFSSIGFTLPPLPIQRAIVQKIETLFTSLDKGIAGLKTAQQQLKVYRQAVLKKAFEGEWKSIPFEECCEKIQDGSHFSPKKQLSVKEEGYYPYITSKNIRNDYMDLSTMTYVDKEFHNSIYNRCNPKLGDVLLTKDGVNTGNVTLNTLDEPFSLLSSVCLIRPKSDIILSPYIKYYIQSPVGFNEITGKMTGTAIKRIILKKIKDALIPVPSINEQKQIIKEIESRLSVCDKVEQSITEALEKAEALRQSILKKAFEGRLLSEAEIAKCKQEADYEPASELLARIKKEKNGK